MDLSGLYIEGTGTYEIKEITTAVPGLLEVGDKVLTCTSPGTVAFASDQAYGEWEFDLYKGADANNLTLAFIADDINIYPNTYSSYWLQVGTAEEVYLRKVNGATVNELAESAGSYIDNATWYRSKITRTLDGEFYVYIKGGDFGTDDWTLVSVSGGSGANPVTDNTYTTSKYFLLNIDTGDRMANIIMRKAVKQ